MVRYSQKFVAPTLLQSCGTNLHFVNSSRKPAYLIPKTLFLFLILNRFTTQTFPVQRESIFSRAFDNVRAKSTTFGLQIQNK